MLRSSGSPERVVSLASRQPRLIPPSGPSVGPVGGAWSGRSALRGTAEHQRYGGPFRPPRAPGRPAAGPAWVGPGWSAGVPGCAPGVPVPSSPPVGLAAGRAAGRSGPCAPSSGGSGPLGLSAGRPPRRRGPGAPPAAPAAAWAGPVPGGRKPRRCLGPRAGWSCRPVSAAPVRLAGGGPGLLRPSGAPCPSRAGSPSPGPCRAARQRHGPPRLLPRGARQGRPGAALLCRAAPPSFWGWF